MKDKFARRWSLFRQVYEVAPPGAIKDIRYTGRAVVLSLARPLVDEKQFQAAAIGMLGLGSLVRGTQSVTPLLSRLFSAMELETMHKDKIDIREFVGALYILEFARGSSEEADGYQDGIEVAKVLGLLLELFDEDGFGCLKQKSLFKTLLLFAGNKEWAEKLHGFCSEICAEKHGLIQASQVLELVSVKKSTLGELDRASYTGREIMSGAIQKCLSEEERMDIVHRSDLQVAEQVAARVRAACWRTNLGAIRCRLLKRLFSAWKEYAKWRVRKRFGRKFGAQVYERKQARNAFAKLLHWRRARQENYNGYVLSQLWYRRQLLRRSMEKFKRMHEFYALKRSLVVKQHLSAYTKAFKRLNKVMAAAQESRKQRKLHDAFWTLQTVNRLAQQREARALAIWTKRLQGRFFKAWASAWVELKQERLKDELRRRNRASMHEMMLKSRQDARATEIELVAFRQSQMEKERRHRKYARLTFAGIEEKRQHAAKDALAHSAQAAARKERIQNEEENFVFAVEARRAELVLKSRENAIQAVRDKAAIMQLAADAKKIKRNLNIFAEVELTQHQTNLLQKWGGFIDYLPPPNDESCASDDGSTSSCSEPEYDTDTGVDSGSNAVGVKLSAAKGPRTSQWNNRSHLHDASQTVLSKRKSTWGFPGRRDRGGDVENEEEVLLLHEHVDHLSHILQVVHKSDRTKVVKNDKKLTFQRLIDGLVRWQTIEHMVDYDFHNSIKVECELFAQHLKSSASATRIQRFWRGCKQLRETRRMVAKKNFETASSAASVLQRFWRRASGWGALLAELEKNYYCRIDPNTHQPYYINALTGSWTYENPFSKRGPKVEKILRPRTAWIMLYDATAKRIFYKAQATGEMSWNFPLGYFPCSGCGIDFAERACTDCRYVENGRILAPKFCIPCWTMNGAHLRHVFQVVDN